MSPAGRTPRRPSQSVSGSSRTTVPAGLMKIFNVGTLIIGDSGIGKSESAAELIARGHKFVSDDVVILEISPRGRLVGTAPPLSRDFMELRGLGIINIREVFGPQAIRRSSNIDLVIRLRKWQRGADCERLGLDIPADESFLGVKVPLLNIPVAPGRNIATLIEIACRVHVLRKKGYHAPREIVRRLDEALE